MEKENQNTTLGEKFKQARNAAKLSIDEIAGQTKIPAKYLYWLENGEYEKMPSEVYVKGFIAKYARILNLERDELIKIYLNESGMLNKIRNKKNVIPTMKYPKLIITPKSLALLLSAVAFIGILGYFSWQIYFLMRPPQILLGSMQDDFVTKEEHHLLEGSVSGANTLTINDKTVNFNEKGEFSESVNLSEGLNVVELKAKNSLGKETTLIRKIILNK